MPNKIVDLQIDKVASVDRAANKRKFLIIKRHEDSGGEEELVIDGLEKSVESVDKIGRKISGKRGNRLQDIFQKLKDILSEAGLQDDNINKEERMELKEMLENEDVVKHFDAIQATAIEEITKSKDELQSKVDDLTAKVDSIEKKDEKVDIWKGVSPEVKTQFEDMQKKADAAEKLAKSEKEARLVKEYQIEAESFAKVGSNEVISKMLRTADNESEDAGNGVRELLKGMSAKIDNIAILTKEIGADGSESEGDSWGKIEALAKSHQEANGGTIEQARVAVLNTPEGIALNKKYDKESEGSE